MKPIFKQNFVSGLLLISASSGNFNWEWNGTYRPIELAKTKSHAFILGQIHAILFLCF